MTVNEYLEFVYALKKCKLEQEEHLNSVCEMAGLCEVRERLIRNLSKGYRQRVGLAQALIGDPRVLILDEPTVGLDPKQIIEIREVIRALGRDHTVILSSHILPEVQAVCDRILVMQKGRIVADGTPAQLNERMGGTERLQMTIEGEPEEVLNTLRAVPGVAEAVLSEKDGKKSIYHISAEPEADVRRAVFDALSQRTMAILSMQQMERSLEDIFLELTEDEPEKETQPEQQEPPEQAKKAKRRLFHRKRGGDK
jgi:ABC-2 type transport system ATP-binding protein